MKVWFAIAAGAAAMIVGFAASAADSGKPPQRYSYYSPGIATLNLGNLEFEPGEIRSRGLPLPSDLIVLTGLSQTLVRLSPTGKVRWSLNVQGGGGAYGLSQVDSLLVICFGTDILLVDPVSGAVVRRLSVLQPGPEQVLNFLRVQGDLLIAGESRVNGDLIVAEFIRHGGEVVGLNVVHRIPTRMEAPRDALFVSARQLLVADTFGHAVVLLELRGGRWRETRRWAEYFPNMLSWRDGELTVLAEHANRIARWELQSGGRRAVVSCPHPLFSDWRTRPEQILVEEPRTRSGESPPRQLCSTDIAGDQTLYAANGFFDEGNGRLWVADADNHRVALFIDGRFHGAVTGINHPIRVIPLHPLH